MGRIAPDEVFDTERFLNDALKHMDKHNITVYSAGVMMGRYQTGLNNVLKGRAPLTLMWAVLLANLCDLSLDKYAYGDDAIEHKAEQRRAEHQRAKKNARRAEIRKQLQKADI